MSMQTPSQAMSAEPRTRAERSKRMQHAGHMVARENTHTRTAAMSGENVIIEPSTHARHVYGQRGNTQYYQYTYDSRDDPRYKNSSGSGLVHAQQVIVSQRHWGSSPRQAPPQPSYLYDDNKVVVEEAADAWQDALPPMPTFTHREPRASLSGSQKRVSAQPIVEEPDDDDDGDVNDSCTTDSHRQRYRRPHQEAPFDQPMASMFDPFAEMNRMHAAMMHSMMAPTMLSMGHGAWRSPFEDDAFLFSGFGAPLTTHAMMGAPRFGRRY